MTEHGLRYMKRDILCELLSIKKPQTTLQNKVTPVQTIAKCWIKTPRRASKLSLRFLTVRKRWEWIILAVWIAHFRFFISTLQQTWKKKKKKKNGVRTLTAEPPPPSLQTSAVLAGPPLPFLAYVLFRWPHGIIHIVENLML